MKRAAIYAHYDEAAELKPYVVHILESLRQVCSSIAFVSTACLPRAELAKLDGLVTSVQLKENIGLDFGMWQSALSGLAIDGLDELLLVNSSVIGPVFPLLPILDEMARAPVDFWGMTESKEIKWHLQSYFLCFKRPVLSSGQLSKFFSSVLPYRDKEAIILSYELGLTSYLVDQGFRAGSFCSPQRVTDRAARRQFNKRRNLTLFCPRALLEAGMPFVKVSLFRDNPIRVRLGSVYSLLERMSFDMTLLPKPRQVPVRAEAKGFWSWMRQRVASSGNSDRDFSVPRKSSRPSAPR